MVINRADRDLVAPGQFGVCGMAGIGQVVFLEKLKLKLFARLLAVGAKILNSQREQLPLPFAMKHRFGSVRVRALERPGFGAVRVERGDRHRTASLLPLRSGVLVGDKTVQRHTEVSSERSLAGIELREEAAFQSAGEEALGQVLRLFVVSMPLQADVLVDG